MSVLAVGLSHRSSPVALLERVTMDERARRTFMAELVGTPSVSEGMVVATCNRLEVYAEVDKFHGGVATITDLLSWHTGVPTSDLTRHLYVHYEERAVQHLFSVACGLDSMVVGEGQILGQVRDSLKEAQRFGTLGRSLNDLGQRALRVGKRAHTETHLDQAGADMVSAGLAIAARHLYGWDTPASAAASPELAGHCPMGATGTGLDGQLAAAIPDPQRLTGRRVLILGAGSMSALAANTAARQGASAVIVANRTYERAARLAECMTEAYDHVRSRAVEFARAAEELATTDIVISCTGSQGLVLTRDDAAPASASRNGRPLVLLDLALPHDIDPAVRQLPDVSLVTLEDMRRVLSTEVPAESNLPHPPTDITAVRDIVEEEVAEYRAVRRADLVAPTVVALRTKAATVVEAELSRLHGRLPELDDKAREEITHAMRRVVDKLLHQPTVRIKQLASAPDGDTYEAALRELFDLAPVTDPLPDPVASSEPATGEE